MTQRPYPTYADPYDDADDDDSLDYVAPDPRPSLSELNQSRFDHYYCAAMQGLLSHYGTIDHPPVSGDLTVHDIASGDIGQAKLPEYLFGTIAYRAHQIASAMILHRVVTMQDSLPSKESRESQRQLVKPKAPPQPQPSDWDITWASVLKWIKQRQRAGKTISGRELSTRMFGRHVTGPECRSIMARVMRERGWTMHPASWTWHPRRRRPEDAPFTPQERHIIDALRQEPGHPRMAI